MLGHCWLKEGGRGEGELTHAEPLLTEEGEGGEKEESVSA